MALSVAEIANTTVDYFLSLKGRWRVAVAAMIYRCKELGILNADQVKYMWKQMNARSIRKREALDDAFAPFEADGTRLSRRAPQMRTMWSHSARCLPAACRTRCCRSRRCGRSGKRMPRSFSPSAN